MPLSDSEKLGITDLLYQEEENKYILLQLVKYVTNNKMDITTIEEALEIVHIHSEDILSLLNKRAISKEVLFKYLHKRKVPVSLHFTKITLIKKVLDYWSQEPKESDEKSTITVIHSTTNETVGDTVKEYPIHLLARQFSEWFFKNYNDDMLKVEDFWPDACLCLHILANDDTNEGECSDAESLLQMLHETRQRFSFFFLPNLTNAGVQGRMDVHGLVVVLACGTLHTVTNCVGVFECAFGLLRDPFADGNWKCKNIKLILRSKHAAGVPSLVESDSLREALTLPIPEGDLT